MFLIPLLFLGLALFWMILSQLTVQTKAIQEMNLTAHIQQYGPVPKDIADIAANGDEIEAAAKYRDLTGCSTTVANARIAPLLPKPDYTLVVVVFVAGSVVVLGFIFSVLLFAL